MAHPFLVLELPNEAATEVLAEDVAACLQKGDTIALSGDLGAGKTTFARALIRALAGDLTVEVPSPTFTLVQTYALPRLTVAHIDLYRVRHASEIEETGLADAVVEGAAVIEWPERGGALIPPDRLDVALEMAGKGRRASLSGGKDWQRRIARGRAARAFLEAKGFAGAHRFPTSDDNGPRQADRVMRPDQRAILTEWPAKPAAAGLSSVDDLVAANAALRGLGLSAPELFAADAKQGLVLIEDLGRGGMVDGDAPVPPERGLVAIETLAEIHFQPRPPTIRRAGSVHRFADLAGDALALDVARFADVYLPHATGRSLAKTAREELERLWWAAFERLVEAERTWVIRPFGFGDLGWLPDREGLRRVGFAGVEELRMGPAAYNLVALCQDPRVGTDLASDLVRHYLALRGAANAHFDADAFAATYAILAALRASGNLGSAASLLKRGRTAASAEIPRLLGYLRSALAHPVLSDLAVWYDRHLAQRS